MAIESPSENDGGVADERAVRSFLEQAAPIILESQVLDGQRFETVRRLADDLGLSLDQLACELRLLEQRGVITSAPWDQIDDVSNQPNRRSAVPTSSQAPTATPPVDPEPDLPSPPPPEIAEEAASPTRSKPPGMPPLPGPVTISTSASAIEALRARAVKLVARRGSLSAKTRLKLEKAGKQAGLSRTQIASVLDAFPEQDSGVGPPLPAAAPLTPDGLRPAAPSPSESFRRWIDQKLSGYPSSILAIEDENGLVGVGVHRYHLAQVLATHVVRDVATERGVRLERDLESASCNSTVATSGQASADDQKLQEFFEQVAPILTQHRGINAKSRVMMNAVADRLGLTEAELERALATLKRSIGNANEEDPRQLERRESFRAYLRRAMAQLPNGIITFKTELRLCQAGEHFHGVAAPWIKSTINEVASEIGARFISKQQAIEHITTLVEDQLSDRPIIDNTTRARIYTEGTRWGLDPIDVDTIFRERTETLRRQLAADRRRSRWVINFVIGGLAIAGTIVVLGVLLRPLLNKPPATTTTPKVAQPVPAPKQLSGLPWWDNKLRIAVARLRVTRPDLRPILDDLISDLPSKRGQTYENLVRQFSVSTTGRNRRDDGQQIFASLYAMETSDSAARSLATALLAGIKSLDAGFPEEPESIEPMFWSCRVAAAILKYPDTPVLRRSNLATQLDAVTLTKGDVMLDVEALQRFYCGALAQRLYQSLTQLAATDPKRVGQFYGTIYSLAESYLDTTTLDQLDVEFLAAILPAVGEEWDRYGDAARRASISADPNTVIKLLGIYRRTTDDRLRNYLAGQFFHRLGAASGTLTEEEMIDAIRESLGVASKERDHRRWSLLTETVDDLLSRKHVERTNPDVLLQETLELAHAATLACALTRGDTGGPIFDEMQVKGPVKLALSGGPWSTTPPDKYESRYPVTNRTLLESSITKLSASSSVAQQTSLLQMIANQTGSVPDIGLQAGQALAEYLVQFKPNDAEHKKVLEYVERLGRWNAVRLGLADQLLKSPGRGDTQLHQLFSTLLEKDVTLTTSADRDAIRRELLSTVLGGFSETPDSDDPQFRAFDEGSKALFDLYASQAKLLGVPAGDYTSARQPSSVLAVLIHHLAAQLSGSKLDAADQALLNSIPYRLKAADFVADSDLQFTAALQQLWLQLLAMHVTGQRSDKAAIIRDIRNNSGAVAQDDQRVFEQLRDLQTDILRIWMQLRPASEGVAPEETGV